MPIPKFCQYPKILKTFGALTSMSVRAVSDEITKCAENFQNFRVFTSMHQMYSKFWRIQTSDIMTLLSIMELSIELKLKMI